MNINISQRKSIETNLITTLIKDLQRDQNSLGLQDGYIYYEFPVYKDLDQEIIVAELLLISKKHVLYAE